MSQVTPNETILHYKILEEIGRGGMGVVYKAEDTKLKRTIALKFLAPHILATDEDKSRFIHEAQAAAALHHPNICTIYEINGAKGLTFISMACLEGRTLSDKLGDGRMKPLDAVRIALQIARGLKAAHEKGVVHRDIKSSNVMIGEDGRATIMDFGLAKSVHQTHVTRRGTQLGTIAYMSPEQTAGNDVDHRTDIWSLGVLVYEMLTGRHPFRGDYDEAIIYSILNEEPDPLTDSVTDTAPDLVYVVRKALAKDPSDRYRTAAAMAEDLEIIYDELRTGSSSSRIVRANGIRRGRGQVIRALFATRSIVTLAVYLLAAWAAVRLVGWSVNRFVLSPHLVSIAMVGLLCLIPTVWILAARNGARTRVWSLITRIGVPANIVVTLIVLFAVSAGRDIGAATETVAVRDETGETIERVVPKNEFRKSLALYLPTNASGDAGYDWAEAAVGVLLEIDLSQDQFLYIRSGFDNAAKQRLQKAGFSRWSDAPWNLKRELAEKANLDYLLTGSFSVASGNRSETEATGGRHTRPTMATGQNGSEPSPEGASSAAGDPEDLVVVPDDAIWEITFRLHNSRNGRLVSENVYQGNDPLALVDEATVQIKRDMGLPSHHIETAKDLPVSETVTHSMPALALFARGLDLAFFRNDWLGGLDVLERSVEYDSTFAYAHCLLHEFYVATNMPEKRAAALKTTMRHLYKLPERIQFVVKAWNYAYAQEPEKTLDVLELWSELYPNDVQARVLIAMVVEQRGERDRAIEQYEKILEIDPSRKEFLNAIAGQHREKGDFDTAISYYEAYAREHPDDAEVFRSMGEAFEIQGKYDSARENYERALLIDPGQIGVLVDLADIHGKLSEDEEALEMYQQALEISKTSQERARVHGSLRSFYSNRGQMEKSFEHMERLWAEEEQFLPPVNAQITRLDEVCLFVRGGREKRAFESMESLRAQMAPPNDGMLPLGYMCIYIELEDADAAEKELRDLAEFISAYGLESARGRIHWGRAKVEELRGDYEAAIDFYRKNLELNPNEVVMHRDIGRCYRELGQNEKAVESLEKMFRIYPDNPTANYEAALAHHEMGNRAKAMEHLEKALDRWKNADPVYKPAQEARATFAEWNS
jgi:tetratricopeptide (TPR) repeat protein